MLEGSAIGGYRVISQIGVGGMGAVYLAEHALVGRRAAIKVLLPELSAKREIVERFFNEARAMAAVQDAGIVQMFDFGYHTDGSAFIVMELLQGETLHQRIKRVMQLPAHDALRITRQAAGSLAAAHASGIIHRDLKPENLFLVPDGETLGGERTKILDFGIAKLGNDAGHSATMTGALMGTPMYMSPEQCRGAGRVDHRSDIYSLGCVLFFALTGRPPFWYEGVGEIIAAHLGEAPAAPSTFAPIVPRSLDELVLRCLAKRPDDRFQTMSELQAACDALYHQLGAPATGSPSKPGVPLPAGFRSVTPGTDSAYLTPVPRAPAPGPGNPPTTLSVAAGQSGATPTVPPPRRTARWIAVGGGLVAGAMAIAIVASRGGAPGRASSRTPASATQPSSAATKAPPPTSTPSPTPAATPTPTPQTGSAVAAGSGDTTGSAATITGSAATTAAAGSGSATTTPAAGTHHHATSRPHGLHRPHPTKHSTSGTDDLYDDR